MDALHSVLPRILPALFRQGPMSQAKLEAAWRIAVGEVLNRVSRVHLRPEGVIEVQADDQRWRLELKHSSGLISSRLVSLLGAESVKRLEVK
jgi:hypothetical protein